MVDNEFMAFTNGVTRLYIIPDYHTVTFKKEETLVGFPLKRMSHWPLPISQAPRFEKKGPPWLLGTQKENAIYKKYTENQSDLWKVSVVVMEFWVLFRFNRRMSSMEEETSISVN